MISSLKKNAMFAESVWILMAPTAFQKLKSDDGYLGITSSVGKY
jgi:hypothetical protein